MFTGLLYTHVPKLFYLSWFWGFGGHWRFMTGFQNLDPYLVTVTGLWYTNFPYFGSLSWFWRCKEHPCPLSPDTRLWRMLEVPYWGFGSWPWFGYGHSSLIHTCSKFWLFIWIWRCKELPCPVGPDLRLWRTLEVFDWGSGSWYQYDHLSLLHPCLYFWLSILILNVQRTSISINFLFWDLEDTGGSWLGFGIFVLILIWLLVFVTPIFSILALCQGFKVAKNIYVP